MHTEGHDLGKDTVGGTPPQGVPHENSVIDPEHPGYETTDVNVKGVTVFLAGLFGFVLIFFVFCFGMGKVINSALEKQDGPPDKWHPATTFAGKENPDAKRQDLTSNADMQQKELQQMTASFPTPRLDADDGNQATADLHAKEDLLLEHYSSDAAQPGAIRIPIERAMELIAERGLPVAQQAATTTTLMAGDSKPTIQMPLTTGFARTGYELDVMEARKQRLSYSQAEGATHAELAPVK
jgi:hypothetical protein